MERIDVNYINSRYLSGADYMADDGLYIEVIKSVANEISIGAEKAPIILLSGPSGSGKTTTAQMLEKYLDGIGVETHLVSLDNYFKTVGGQKVDYESPSRINADMLSRDVERLIGGEEVQLPTFDFEREVSVMSDVKLKRNAGEIVIFEGIHALNPGVVKIKGGTKKIYVDVTTEIAYGDKVLAPKYIRLMRRMFRDKLYRGRGVVTTLKYFNSVEDGTSKYLLPYRDDADYAINSFTPYETALYKSGLNAELRRVYGDLSGDERVAADIMLEYFSKVTGRDFSSVPANSIIREFIGK